MGQREVVAARRVMWCVLAFLLIPVSGCSHGTQTDLAADSAIPTTSSNHCEQPAKASGRFVVGVPNPSRLRVRSSLTQNPPREPVRLTDVVYERSGSRDGALRYKFDGNGVVSWSANYVASPSGVGAEDVAIAGKCILQVDLSGDSASSEAAVPPSAPQRIPLSTGALLSDLVQITTGPATYQTLAGTRVTTLTVEVAPSPTVQSVLLVSFRDRRR